MIGIAVIGLGAARMDGSNPRVSYLDGTEDVLQDAAGTGTGTGWMAFSHEPHKVVISDFPDALLPNHKNVHAQTPERKPTSFRSQKMRGNSRTTLLRLPAAIGSEWNEKTHKQ